LSNEPDVSTRRREKGNPERSAQSAGPREEKRRGIFDRRAVLLSVGLVLIVLAALAYRFQNAFHFVDFHAATGRTPLQDSRDESEKSVEAPKAPEGPSPAALTRHAAELCQDRKYEECLEEAQKAIEIRPDYAEAYNNKAYALIAMNRLDEAIRDFREAVRLKPDYTTAKENLARALKQKRREEQQPGQGPAAPR
jgi:tetratricopeptide (TPR) repeat protein